MSRPTIKKYIVTSFNKQFYAKITEYPQTYSISAGGKNKYCATIAIDKDSLTEAYIDRVEYDSACVKSGALEQNGGMYKLISAVLYLIKQQFPAVEKFTLKDDSNIYCKKESKQYKLNLAADYILKYNKTWYQANFGATLPPELLEKYNDSLKVLDKPIGDYEYKVSIIPTLEDFKEVYESASSPRNFIDKLRKEYGREYCFVVGGWLQYYTASLHVKLYEDDWFIPIGEVRVPENYAVVETQEELRGGRRSKTRRRRNFSVVAGGDYLGGCMGEWSVDF